MVMENTEKIIKCAKLLREMADDAGKMAIAKQDEKIATFTMKLIGIAVVLETLSQD